MPDKKWSISDVSGPSTAKSFPQAKFITAKPEPTIWDRILNIGTGMPMPGDTPSGWDVVGAGLPFLSYAGKLGRNFVTHGTGRAFDYFDPKQAYTSDILGHFQPHAAARPGYAADYAGKGTIYGPRGERMIPIQPEAQNVLDLYEPTNPDDLAQALATFTPEKRRELIQTWKLALKYGDREKAPKDLAFWMQAELNKPEYVNKLPFDAIRYNDLGEEAWTFPHSTPLKTPWGTPLNQPGTPLKLFKHNKPVMPHAQVMPREEIIPKSAPSSKPWESSQYKSIKDLPNSDIGGANWPKDVSGNKLKTGQKYEVTTSKGNKFDITFTGNTTDVIESQHIINSGGSLTPKLTTMEKMKAKAQEFKTNIPKKMTQQEWQAMKNKKYTKSELDEMYKNNVISYTEYNNLAIHNVKKPGIELPTLFGVPAKPKQLEILRDSDVISPQEFDAIMREHYPNYGK